MILAIEAIGAAAETDELVEVAVVVEVGPRVGLATGHRKEVGLDELETGRGGRSEGENGESGHTPFIGGTLG